MPALPLAVNVGYFLKQREVNTIGFPSIKGFQETGLLSMLNMTSFRDVEPLAPKGVSNEVQTEIVVNSIFSVGLQANIPLRFM